MAFELPALPYEKDALEPYLSSHTLACHYGRYHRDSVTRLNALVEGTANAGKSLEELLDSSTGELFALAAEAWNHTFHWHCLAPGAGGEPDGELAEAIAARFGSFPAFRQAFNDQSDALPGGGWAWLIKTAEGDVEIITTRDGDTPIAHGLTPLLGIDVSEHAYGIDYPHARATYLERIWALINWDFVALNYA
jgi:Fe-Mn family superoxide dismutase